MIEPYLIRSRLFRALGVPASLCPLLHAWAIVEGRKFCHEFMGEQLCLAGRENTVRIAVRRRLDALALFFKAFDYDLGTIRRGGGKDKETTYYPPFVINRAASWIQNQLASDLDTSNPFVAIDRYVPDAIRQFIPKKQKKEASSQKEKKGKYPKSEKRGIYRHILGYISDPLLKIPNCTFESALNLARQGFSVFAVWGVDETGVCRCPRGEICDVPGKHPIPRGWQQCATTYEPTLFKFWKRHPYSNVGIATGREIALGHFLTVIDCDTRHFGHGSLSHLERNELCPLPLTREHSAGGGPHKLYTYPRGFHSSPGAIGQGIDIQSFGKFVIGAGMNARGTRYEVTVDLPIAELPDVWAERIDAVKNKTLPLIREGERRAKLLSWAGGMMRDQMDSDLALEVLRDRRDKRLEKGSHSFSDEDLRGMITYCSRQEGQRKKEQAA